ncbi:MAG: hypothetical protein NC037_03745 [Bacteroides sp.]|nr:hypothetical protein [Bacillota bacterium]MCM1394225.1 hypothetical protein [[Eubacterium] siraeum]MCM1455623.1 hypothetical protein [Bacteroides sp.]
MIVKDGARNLNCFKNTWRYFGDKGFYLVLINLVPALMLPFVLSPSEAMYYLFDMEFLNIHSIASQFEYMWRPVYSYWYIGVIGLALLVFTSAITFGVIDRHMKVGEFTLSPRRIKSRLNYNLLTALKFVIATVIILVFFDIVAILLYFLWATVFKSYAATLVFSIGTMCLVEVLMIYTMCWFILWPPFMLHTGLKSSSAFKSAFSSMGGRLTKTAFSICVPIIFFQAVMIITAAFKLGVICRVVLDGVAYAIIIPYYFTLMYNTFYEVTGTERMDIELKKKDIWAKK